jgi:hypothetical protein
MVISGSPDHTGLAADSCLPAAYFRRTDARGNLVDLRAHDGQEGWADSAAHQAALEAAGMDEAEAEAEAHKAALTPRKAKKKAKTGSGVGKSPATPNTEDAGPAKSADTDSPLSDEVEVSLEDQRANNWLKTLRIAKKSLGSKFTDDDSDEVGGGSGENAVRIITTTNFHPVKVLAFDTVTAIIDYVAREGTGGRELSVVQLLTEEAINALTAEVKADKNVPTANKNWLDWDTESTLKFLRGKYLINSKTAKMDVDQVIEKTIIDLTPESRTKLN